MDKNNNNIKGVIAMITFVILGVCSRIIILDNYSSNTQILIMIIYTILVLTSLYYSLKYYLLKLF